MRFGLLAGMLYVDEQGPKVGRLDHAGDLAAGRTYEKASDLARARICGEHLVVADVLPVWTCHVLRRGIGLDPQDAASIYVQAVGLGEREGGRAALEWILVIGIARLHEDVPLEAGGTWIAIGLAPADDMSHQVRRPGIGRVRPKHLGPP